MTRWVTLVALLLCGLPLVAQTRPTIYIGDIKGNDEFFTERYRMLFMEELMKLKSIDVVTTKDAAQYILEGIGSLDRGTESSASGETNSTTVNINSQSGLIGNALLSITINELSTGKVVFVGNQSTFPSAWKNTGSTQTAVRNMMREIKKRLKWR